MLLDASVPKHGTLQAGQNSGICVPPIAGEPSTSAAAEEGSDASLQPGRGDSAGPVPQGSLNPLKWLKKKAKQLKQEVLAMYYALHDPDTPFLCKVIPFVVIGYALSPLDLIPDFIPVLGLLDDLILLPVLIYIAIQLIPSRIMKQARERAEHEPLVLSKAWPVAVIVFAMWLACLEWLAWYLCMRFGSDDVKVWTVPGMVAMGCAASIGFAWWLVRTVRQANEKAAAKNAALRTEGLADPLLGQADHHV